MLLAKTKRNGNRAGHRLRVQLVQRVAVHPDRLLLRPRGVDGLHRPREGDQVQAPTGNAPATAAK